MKRPYNATVFCWSCGEQFETYTWEINRGKGKYCSKTCLGLATLPHNQIKPAKNYSLRHMARKNAEQYLMKEPCKICGSIHSEAHHEDYAKPLNVNWLCRKHHMQRHVQL